MSEEKTDPKVAPPPTVPADVPEAALSVAGAGQRATLVQDLAARWGIQPERFLEMVKRSIFAQEKAGEPPYTNEECFLALTLAHRYKLDPWTKQVYLARMRGRVTAMIAVDGWLALMQGHPQYDGIEFGLEENEKGPVSVTATAYRRDLSRPVSITEYLVECRRETDLWRNMPRRMLRWAAAKQVARVGFGFSGVRDAEDFADPEVRDLGRAPVVPDGGHEVQGAPTAAPAIPTEVVGPSPSATRAPEAQATAAAARPGELFPEAPGSERWNGAVAEYESSARMAGEEVEARFLEQVGKTRALFLASGDVGRIEGVARAMRTAAGRRGRK